MTLLTTDARAPGGVEGTGPVLIVDHTADNNLVTFRFKNKDVKMLAAEEDFELSGHKFRAGAIIVPDANRATLEPMLRDLGLSAWAVASAPGVPTHELDVPRIGYVHSWTRTQDEGWWRAALDTFGVPYTYFADQKLREGNLRAKYDVIIFPHVGGSAVSQVNGMPRTGNTPLPYKKIGGDQESRRDRRERRHPRWHGPRRSAGARALRAGGRHAHHRGIDDDDFSGVWDYQRGHSGGAGAALRPRLDSAREDRRHEEPDRLRVREQPTCRCISTRHRCSTPAAAASAASAGSAAAAHQTPDLART